MVEHEQRGGGERRGEPFAVARRLVGIGLSVIVGATFVLIHGTGRGGLSADATSTASAVACIGLACINLSLVVTAWSAWKRAGHDRAASSAGGTEQRDCDASPAHALSPAEIDAGA